MTAEAKNSCACPANASRDEWTAVALILAVHIALCMWGAWRHSPTVDEPAYLASGISHWEFGRFDLCRVSPPLVRLVAGRAVLMASPELDWDSYRIGPGVRAEHPVGRDFLIANGSRSFWLFTVGRWACLPFTLIGALVSYRWARELFGVTVGFSALLLWCFSPNILAHAQMLTPDTGVTALSLAACYSFWRWSQSPTWWRAAFAGLVLGLAVLAKTNAVVLFPAILLSVAVNALVNRELRRLTCVAQVSFSLLAAVYTINLGYGFEGSLQQLGDYKFFSRTFAGQEAGNRFSDSWLAAIPVPLPSAFLEGIDLQRRDFENSSGNMKTYLRGQWYDHGWWWYYFYVIAVKVPVGTLLLTLLGFVLLCMRQAPGRVAVFCYAVLPGLALFALPCTQTGFGHSLRYILPAFPFAFLLAVSTLASPVLPIIRNASMVLLSSAMISSLAVYPHSLSYFNEVAGGPTNGHYHLLDGNLDWGQDLLLVSSWVEAQSSESRPVYVATWGWLPQQELGIDSLEPPEGEDATPQPGTYAISINFLRREFRSQRNEFSHFLNRKPAGHIGYSMNVYHVE